MPLVHSGPPEWVFERPSDTLKWEVKELPSDGPHAVYEISLYCGLQILRMHVFNQEEAWALVDALTKALPKPTA